MSIAQETFNYIGGSGIQTWEDPANWSGGSGSFSQFPGDAPAAGTLDSVDFSVNPPASTLDIRISTSDLTVDMVRLPLVGTIIRGLGAGTFTANWVEPTPGSAGIGIFADFVMPEDTVEFRPGMSTIILNRVLNRQPGAIVRTIRNEAQTMLTVNGEVILSDTPGSAGGIRFRNGGLPAATTINGVISDGAAAGGRIHFSRGNFHVTAENTYSGVTQIGENDPNVETIVEISTDLAFGTSRVDFTGGNALKTVLAKAGLGTRTLANDVRISRSAEFSGAESFVLNGLVYQSNGRELINSISPSKSLTINGNIYASDSTDVRDWIFEGAGRTIVNSVIDDALGFPEVTGASIIKRDSGRLEFTNPGVAAYGGQTTVNGGVLQLGNGGAAVGLNGNLVTGNESGTMEINHNQSLEFASPIGGALNVTHVGTGTTVLSGTSSGSGPIHIQAGTLLVDGATGSGTVNVAIGATVGGSGTIGGLLNASGEVSPGSSTGVLTVGSVNFGGSSSLVVELAGLVAGLDYDQLLVNTSANLDGELVVELANDFLPQSAHAFTIVSAGTLSGAFENIASGERLDTLGGEGSFLVSYDGSTNAVVLSGFLSSAGPGLSGDFNGDGIVDAADYTVWRNHLGEEDETNLNFNGDGDDVGPSDYAIWKAHYGASNSGSGGLAGSGLQNVPEPGTIILLIVGFASLNGGWRCRQ